MYTLTNCISSFRELAYLTEDEYFKSAAYSNAANILTNMSEDEFDDRDDFTDIYGIGASINSKIIEYKESGKIAKLQTLRAESATYLDPYYYKVRKEFITKKIEYNDAVILLNKMKPVINCSKAVVAGSFRRKKDLVGDLDLLVPARSYSRICKDLEKAGYRVISHGEYKSQFMIDENNNVPMDVISYTKSDYIFQLLYLTGSKETNIRMRREAAKRGYLLNQYGLYDREDPDIEIVINPKSEEEVFDALGMSYIAPCDR